MSRGLLLALGVAAVVGALGECGAVNDHRTKVQPADIARARAFKGFDLYYVGDSFRGFPLAKIFRSPSHPSVTFWYGDCEPVGGEGACSYPISIHVSDICRRHFKMYGLPVTRLTRVRGVPAGQFGNGLELYTGDATIVISLGEVDQQEVARGLRSLDGRVTPSEALPAPLKGALSGRPAGCRSMGPGRVKALRARTLSESEILLSFSAPEDPIVPSRPPASRFLVKQSTRPIRSERDFGGARTLCGGRPCSFSTPARVGQRLSLRVTGLRRRTTYYYAVKAVGAAHLGGPRSKTARARTR